MNRNFEITEYLDEGGNIKMKKEASELSKWQEFEEALHEAHKQIGCNDESDCGCIKGGSFELKKKWTKLTGMGRQFNCFMGEVEQVIKGLGGKLLAERPKKKKKNNYQAVRLSVWG